MEEDIKILEKLSSIYQELKKDFEEGHASSYEMQFEDFTAIENLLKRYKELEEENKALELEKESYKNDYFDIYERTKRYIKEEDVIELQKKIHKDLDNNGITRAYQIIIDKYFNELIGDISKWIY